MAYTPMLVLVGALAVFAAPSAALTDADILNFALNLECLEVGSPHPSAEGLQASTIPGHQSPSILHLCMQLIIQRKVTPSFLPLCRASSTAGPHSVTG